MMAFLELVVSFFERVISKLDSVSIMTVGAVSVSLFDLLLSFIVFSMIASIFWKGVKG